jgi:serine/threonine protein kinase
MTLTSTAPVSSAVGGYRLVRTLGAGPRATVYLGHADGHPQVAVKVFAASVPPAEIEAEATALMRAAGDHVVRLEDLSADASGRPVFLLQRIGGPSLGALLDRRRSIRPGEAVTILAPIAATLDRMHRSGVVHGGVESAAVLFSETGAPTLVGFGDARLLALEATGRSIVAERTELLERDAIALRGLLVTVLESTRFGSAAEGATAERLLDLDPTLPGYPERLAEAVFELAEPEPIDFDAPPALPGAVDVRPAAGASRMSAPARGMVLDGLQAPEWLRGPLGEAAAVLSRGRAAARAVRRPFWVAGGAGALALGVVLLLPPTPADREVPAVPPSSAAPSTEPSVPEAGGAEAAILGDDPADAATALLALRADCFRDLSVLCLDAVTQPDSAAAAADTAAILAAQEGSGIGPSGVVLDGPAKTVERLGDTALVRVTPADAEPASVLMIRTEAGWRIRGFPSAAEAGAGE